MTEKKKMDLIQQCTVYSMINFRPDKFLKTKVITNNKTTNKRKHLGNTDW